MIKVYCRITVFGNTNSQASTEYDQSIKLPVMPIPGIVVRFGELSCIIKEVSLAANSPVVKVRLFEKNCNPYGGSGCQHDEECRRLIEVGFSKIGTH